MVWTGGDGDRLAPALLTLLHQLQAAYPGQGWINSPQTGTIGDRAHRREPSSDHNPWLDSTVRALDVAVNVSGVPGIVTVTDGPPGAELAAMVNRMFALKDPRVWPDGYAIFRARITDPANPGGTKPYAGDDPHLYHVHISVSRNPAGFNSTEPWPLSGESSSSSGGVKIPPPVVSGGRMFRIIHNVQTNAYRLVMPGVWSALEGSTPKETEAIVEYFRKDPLCAGNRVEDVSNAGMQLTYNAYMKGKATL
jgi:hypothetical protein